VLQDSIDPMDIKIPPNINLKNDLCHFISGSSAVTSFQTIKTIDMKTTLLSALMLIAAGAFFSCEPSQTPVQEEYDYWLAKHDSSHRYHELVDKRHRTMLANHEELSNFLSTQENPDTALMNDIERHTRFYAEHENIMENHAVIMKEHEAFKKRYDEGKITDEELRAKLDSMKHDHQHMDIDHEYVMEMTTKIRSEHNEMRRRLNESLQHK